MVRRYVISGFVVAIALSWFGSALAEDPGKSSEPSPQLQTATRIFSQLLMTGHPQGFELASFEKVQNGFYIRESVAKGESVNDWHQMITVTGMKDLALSRPELTAKMVLNRMVEGFKHSCPFSFSTQVLNDSPISGFDAAVAVASCGTATGTAGKTSEAALIAVIKGLNDFYTVQWAERATPSNGPIPIDVQEWTDRFKALGPITLAPEAEGRKPQ